MRLREQKTLFLIFCKVADFSTSKINILKKERFTNEKVIDIMKISIAQVKRIMNKYIKNILYIFQLFSEKPMIFIWHKHVVICKI